MFRLKYDDGSTVKIVIKYCLAWFILYTHTCFFEPLRGQELYPIQYNADSIMLKGSLLNNQGAYEAAMLEFSKIFRTDPSYQEARYEKILALTNMEKYEEVKSQLQALFENKEIFEKPELMILYGNLLSLDSAFVMSEKIFEEAKKLMPNSSILHYNLALMYYRKADLQKSIDHLKIAIHHHPRHQSAHYLLGLICFDEGKIAEGALALLGCLVNDPNGEQADQIMANLNVKMSQNYLKESTLKFSKSGDDFTELTSILRNQLPLNPKYKLKVDIDEIFTRQVQAIVEYAASHKIEDGFFEKNYLRWLQSVAKNNDVEALIYYLLQAKREELGKKLTSKDKIVTTFTERFILGDFWSKFGQRQMDLFGRMEEVTVLLSDGFPYLIGKVEDGKYQGPFMKVTKHGQVNGHLYFKDNQAQGLQKYFYENGVLSEEVQFKDNNKDGWSKNYYTNGSLSSEEIYKNDTLHGAYATYYPNGGKNCEGTYVNGIENGNLVCYHEDGSIRIQAQFVEGKLHGKHLSYNVSGDLISSFEYLNGDLNGEGIEYFDGKMIKSKATYLKGKPIGTVAYYHENQALQSETMFTDGKMTSFRSFRLDGSLSESRSYDDKERVKQIQYFTLSGEKYYEEKYDDGNFKEGLQYVKNQLKPIALKPKDNRYIVKSLDGTVLIDGQFTKGKMTGKWKYYHLNGLPYAEYNYIDNVIHGEMMEYSKSGLLERKLHYHQGQLSGLASYYNNGKLNQISYFNQDEKTGPMIDFKPNGKINYEAYLINNDYNFDLIYYYDTGNIYSKAKYINNQITAVKSYKIDGSLEYETNFMGLNGTEVTPISQGQQTLSIEFKNGVNHGKKSLKDHEGKLIQEYNYKAGVVHGPVAINNYLGNREFEANYYNGKLHGESKYFDLNGALRVTYQNQYGLEIGKVIRYYVNGQKAIEYESMNEEKHGEVMIFNMNGEKVVSLGYVFGYLDYYKILDEKGNLSAPILVNRNETLDIRSNYPNGKTGLKLKIVAGNFDGGFEIYDQSGNPNHTSFYKMGLLEGQRKEYYPDGNVYKKEDFVGGNNEGLVEYFDQEGKPIIQAEYKNDQLSGTLKAFKNGVLQNTKRFDGDFLISID